MKKGTKIGIVIGASVLAVVVALVLVFSLVTTKPLEELSSYKNAIIYQDSATSGYHVSSTLAGKEEQDKKLKSLLKDCSFSLMQSIFSGRTQTENSNYYENGEVVKFTQTELTGSGTGLYSKYDKSLPKLKLVFDEVKKAKIGSKTYEFDTVEILVANTYGEIREIICIAWDSTKFDLQDEETEFEGFPVFKIHANTTELYNFMMNVND
jgi:hypothetical protein